MSACEVTGNFYHKRWETESAKGLCVRRIFPKQIKGFRHFLLGVQQKKFLTVSDLSAIVAALFCDARNDARKDK